MASKPSTPREASGLIRRAHRLLKPFKRVNDDVPSVAFGAVELDYGASQTTPPGMALGLDQKRSRVPVPFKRDEDVPSVCVLRVKRDIADIVSDPPPGIYVAPNDNDITQIDALVVGPSDTPYEGGFLLFHLACPPKYPIEPPRVRVLTTDAGRVALHPVFYRSGDLSLSILGTYAGPPWSSAQSLSSLLVSIQSLLTDDPFYENPYAVKGMQRQEANDYKVYVRHEVVRVAVCDAVESCLQDRSPYPAVLRDTVLKLFLERYDRYEEPVKSYLHLTGAVMRNPFGLAHSTYQFEALLSRLRELKAKVEKRSESVVADAKQ